MHGAGRAKGSRTVALAMAGALVLALAWPACSAGDPSAPLVFVYPVAGATAASPQTQIAFRGIEAYRLGAVTVTGSRSGAHAGAVRGDSDGQGGSFIPRSPFAAGETVTVSTPFDLADAPGGTYRFRVASPAGPIPLIAPTLVSGGAHATVRLRSRPDLAPPAVRILRRLPAAGASDIFLTPQCGPAQNGPMILPADGRLLWFKPVPRRYIASDLRVQTYQGQPVLTWWQG